MASKYYAVKKGKVSGIYLNWNDCKAMVDGYPGAVYKSFKTIEEAEKFINGEKIIAGEKTITGMKSSGENSTYAFVDGSFNKATHTYGYGGFLVTDYEKYVLQGADNDAEMATMRNVAGEIKGAEAAVKKAIELGIKELVIYYDYMGIEMWATGAWKRNKAGTIAYHEYIMSVKDKIKLTFVKVKKDDIKEIILHYEDKYIPLEWKDTRKTIPMKKVATSQFHDYYEAQLQMHLICLRYFFEFTDMQGEKVLNRILQFAYRIGDAFQLCIDFIDFTIHFIL